MHVHNLELNVLSNIFIILLYWEGFCFSAVPLQESLYQLKLADRTLKVESNNSVGLEGDLHRNMAIPPSHVHVLFSVLFCKYGKSSIALAQAFIQLITY